MRRIFERRTRGGERREHEQRGGRTRVRHREVHQRAVTLRDAKELKRGECVTAQRARHRHHSARCSRRPPFLGGDTVRRADPGGAEPRETVHRGRNSRDGKLRAHRGERLGGARVYRPDLPRLAALHDRAFNDEPAGRFEAEEPARGRLRRPATAGRRQADDRHHKRITGPRHSFVERTLSFAQPAGHAIRGARTGYQKADRVRFTANRAREHGRSLIEREAKDRAQHRGRCGPESVRHRTGLCLPDAVQVGPLGGGAGGVKYAADDHRKRGSGYRSAHLVIPRGGV